MKEFLSAIMFLFFFLPCAFGAWFNLCVGIGLLKERNHGLKPGEGPYSKVFGGIILGLFAIASLCQAVNLFSKALK